MVSGIRIAYDTCIPVAQLVIGIGRLDSDCAANFPSATITLGLMLRSAGRGTARTARLRRARIAIAGAGT